MHDKVINDKRLVKKLGKIKILCFGKKAWVTKTKSVLELGP